MNFHRNFISYLDHAGPGYLPLHFAAMAVDGDEVSKHSIVKFNEISMNNQ